MRKVILHACHFVRDHCLPHDGTDLMCYLSNIFNDLLGPYHVADVVTRRVDQLHSEEEIKSLSVTQLQQILHGCGVEFDANDDHHTLASRLITVWLQYAKPVTGMIFSQCYKSCSFMSALGVYEVTDPPS